MGASQRTKGAGFEREIATKFSQVFGRSFTRNLSQSRDGGYDLVVGPLVIECKRRKTLATLRQWMSQVQAACARLAPKDPAQLSMLTPVAQVPMVILREDHGQPLVLIGLDDFITMARDAIQTGIDLTPETAPRG